MTSGNSDRDAPVVTANVASRGILDARLDLPAFRRPKFKSSIALASQKTWRDTGKLPPVRDQRPWETCVSHALCNAHWAIRKIGGTTATLDPELFHQCSLGLDCGSAVPHLQTAVDTYLKRGLPRNGTGFRPRQQCPAEPVPSDPPLRAEGIATPADAKYLISTFGPIIAITALESGLVDLRGFDVYHDSGDALQIASHALMVVGYDDHDACWEVQNSFGAGWGVGGIGRIAYGSARIFDSEYPVFRLT